MQRRVLGRGDEGGARGEGREGEGGRKGGRKRKMNVIDEWMDK